VETFPYLLTFFSFFGIAYTAVDPCRGKAGPVPWRELSKGPVTFSYRWKRNQPVLPCWVTHFPFPFANKLSRSPYVVCCSVFPRGRGVWGGTKHGLLIFLFPTLFFLQPLHVRVDIKIQLFSWSPPPLSTPKNGAFCSAKTLSFFFTDMPLNPFFCPFS